jgi:predicted nucleic acid-binding protein
MGSKDRLVIDTNIFIYLLQGNEKVLSLLEDKYLYISFITEIEILGLPRLTAEDISNIKKSLATFTIINIEEEIKEITAYLRRASKLKLPDAIIAATAIFMNLPLLTSDRQFAKVSELDIELYLL